ncbi:MAG: tRNA (cytidine(34)-2'-O)-methyltransferase [Gammaproteobacteria bacterium]|nr:tRNA (cytidine(34)-2'-O)-methyltransferase [Gammaproteobacteria bacterium]
MFHIVLFEPEIPPNTGNIIRLTVNAAASLHLIHPLGFEINDKHLKRAGMDYSEYSELIEYKSYSEFKKKHSPSRLFAASTKGKRCYADVEYKPGDCIIFGPETRGLPEHVLDDIGQHNILRIPMQKISRSLNLSNAVAIILYEALRQNDFSGT